MLNRCHYTGLGINKPYLDINSADELRKKIDGYLDKKINEWFKNVPHANHFEEDKINKKYYIRHLIETIWRIRLLRVAESKALTEIAKINPIAAQIWANYEREEMTHDELFVQDILAQNASRQEIFDTEPYFSTKLLSGFFSYLLDHEGPLGVIVYSYLVEYVNVKLEPKKIQAMKKSVGVNKIRGQIAHSHTDLQDDHPGEVWQVIRYLINNEQDIKNIYRYIDEMQKILAMYFVEIHQDQIVNHSREAA